MLRVNPRSSPASEKTKIFDLLLTGSEIQDGVSSKFMHGMSQSYQQNRAKLKSKVNCTMAQAGKEYIVDPDTGSGSNATSGKVCLSESLNN